MKQHILGYIYSIFLGSGFSLAVLNNAANAFLLGACGALGGLTIKFLWNLARDYRKRKKG